MCGVKQLGVPSFRDVLEVSSVFHHGGRQPVDRASRRPQFRMSRCFRVVHSSSSSIHVLGYGDEICS